MRVWICLAAALFVSGCCAVDKEAIGNIEKTHEIILPRYREYVEKDRGLDRGQKDDQRKLVESLERLVEALKKSAGGD